MNLETLKAKEAIVKEVVAMANERPALIVVEYRGMNVEAMSNLRKTLRDIDAKLVVYKNSMVVRASEALKYDGFEQYLKGPNAFVFCPDAIAGAKALTRFARRSGKMVVKAAVVEGRVLDESGVKMVAALPGKLGLISMLLSCIQTPIRQFAATVQAVADKN